MPSISTDRRALLLAQAFDGAGLSVLRVAIEGKRVEIFLVPKDRATLSNNDEFELVEMKQ